MELKTYQGRRRVYVKGTSSVHLNVGNTIEYTSFDIENCSLQPATRSGLQALPESYRSLAKYQFWTTTSMVGIDQGTSQLPDQIQINGEWFSCYNLDDWVRTDYLTHYNCIAIREDVNNDPNQTAGGGNYG